jgi:hypothetical protein
VRTAGIQGLSSYLRITHIPGLSMLNPGIVCAKHPGETVGAAGQGLILLLTRLRKNVADVDSALQEILNWLFGKISSSAFFC